MVVRLKKSRNQNLACADHVIGSHLVWMGTHSVEDMGGSLVTRSADICITQPKLCSKYNPSKPKVFSSIIRRFLPVFLVSR